MIANPLFASFTTTTSKSRVNFLKLLRAPHEEYMWNEDALIYARSQGLSLELRARLACAVGKGTRVFASEKAWERQLTAWKVRSDEPGRIVTEAALFGTLMHYEMYVGQPLISDDAGQFKISGLLHAWESRLSSSRHGPIPGSHAGFVILTLTTVHRGLSRLSRHKG